MPRDGATGTTPVLETPQPTRTAPPGGEGLKRLGKAATDVRQAFSCIPAHVCFFSLADLRQHLRYLRLATLLHAACHGLCHVPGACGCRCRYAAARQGDCRNRSPNLTHRSHPTLTLPTPWLPNPLPASHRVSPLPSLFRGEKEKGALLRLRALFPSAIAYVRRTITRINSKIVVFCATNGKWAPSK